ncbi:hypothetical protein AVI53_04190 [Piscirickettsia salmonis]|nr:hypothetical protein PSLF89_06555 [Piscirickettsia salmonis LF-89 = ATCC VR-1361]ALY03123.1 hypothetical protein AWE47_09915 [Piscirickettsia salmonis]AMA42682.1 hypothetical protein AWJ11_10125 [Piscirickettsia salmonis]AOS35154.1 hypothetical protein AVM72_07265 [Piscirickettsia salmonis]APS59859.1 hypothetical protein AVI53_04190 [Piscirickettsia salmonis]
MLNVTPAIALSKRMLALTVYFMHTMSTRALAKKMRMKTKMKVFSPITDYTGNRRYQTTHETVILKRTQGP